MRMTDEDDLYGDYGGDHLCVGNVSSETPIGGLVHVSPALVEAERMLVCWDLEAYGVIENLHLHAYYPVEAFCQTGMMKHSDWQI